MSFPVKRAARWVVPGLLALVLALAAPEATSAGGPGSGGGGGGGKVANPLLGNWGAGTVQIGEDFIRREFTFNKDFTFTEDVVVLNTGEVLDSHSGVYAYGGVGPNGFPVVTLFEGGQVYQREEYSRAAEGLVLRGTISVIIGRL
jgi:hypothetical protein